MVSNNNCANANSILNCYKNATVKCKDEAVALKGICILIGNCNKTFIKL